MKGIVIRATGSWYTIKTAEGDLLECRLKGKFRLSEKKLTNPVVVGDQVVVKQNETGDYVIDEILQRKNYIVRLAPRHQHMQHIIAANLDLAILIVTVARPHTTTGFINRFLVVAENFEVPVLICFNKIDELKQKEISKQQILIDRFTDCGYKCVVVSALTGEGVDDLKEEIQGKITLLSGHSGVGKSTLLNALHPELKIKTAEVSRQTGKGRHTTTFAEMHELPFDGFVIDTPGIKEFALPDIPPENLSFLFPEMHDLALKCKFNNCKHKNEPGCAVIEAVEHEQISSSRYESYLVMLDELESRKNY